MTTSTIFPALTRDEVFRLETRRMWLRWPQTRDAATLVKWVGKPVVAMQTSTFPIGMTQAELEAKIAAMRQANAEGRSLGFVIELKSAPGHAVGMVGAHVRDNGQIELGYHLDPALWGQGLMTEAVAMVADAVFALTRVDSVMAGVKPDNLGSRRVLEKAGFIADGGYEHESPLWGRYAVKRYRRPREKISPLVTAMERHGRGLPEMAFDLCGRV